MSEAQYPEPGDKMIWNNEYYPSITDLTVRIIESTNDYVTFEVLNDNMLQERVRAAEKTYSDNGNNVDNVLEVCPLVQWDDKNEEFIPQKEHIIIRYNNNVDQQLEKE